MEKDQHKEQNLYTNKLSKIKTTIIRIKVLNDL